MKKNAFTLVELLVVIAIIGLIATLSVIALGNARAKSRDAKRVSDIKQVQTALELFFSDQGRYPTVEEWNRGSLYATGTFGTTTYMERRPNDPQTSLPYNYLAVDSGANYNLSFSLENQTGSYSQPGIYVAAADSVKYNGIADDLVAWWKFNEGSGSVLHDFSGKANNGVLTGPIWVSSSTCLYGKTCLSFDGVNDYVLVTEPNNDLSPGPGNYTIATWVKFNTLVGNQRIYHKAVPTDGQYKYSIWKHDGVNYYFDYGVYNNGISGQQIGTSGATAGIWHFLVGTIDRSAGTAKFYEDGILLYTKTGVVSGSNYIGATNTSCIGTENCWTQPLNGYLQDLRIYKRYFTAEEVLDLYNSTKP